MWWKARGGGKLGIALARDAGQPVMLPDEKAEAVATCTARGREDAPAAARHASLIVFVEINCFRPGDPQHCASQCVLRISENWHR
jgi:hypothetical protein